MQQFKKLKQPSIISLSLCLVIISIGMCSFQPLQVNMPITMYHQYGDVFLDYAIPAETQASVLFCFVGTDKTQSNQTQQSDGSKVSACQLKTKSRVYFCINLYKTQSGVFSLIVSNVSIDIGSIWTTRKRTANYSSNVTVAIGSSTASVTLLAESLTQTIRIANYFQNRTIYHMLTCPDYSASTNTCSQMWKQNYVHTFQHPEKKINLIVQRFHYCGIYKKQNQIINNHVFYGGVLRSGKYYLFIAILTYLQNTSQTLNMWGGISYSSDHANRDMFCYASDGSSFDAVSLIAGPVYKDVASNIGGTNDAQILDDFYSQRYRQNSVYFIQYHRPYETTNSQGDQNIFKKIYAKFAFAAYFDNAQSSQSILVTPNCLSSSYKHNFLMVFNSDVEVYQKNYYFPLLLMGFFYFLI